jgi:type IV pilus assembly protein PilX
MKPIPSAVTVVRRAWQGGVSMLYALMALVVLSLSAVALVRTVDSGLLAMGNLGFKQDATASASAATEAAIAYLQANVSGTVLYNDVVAQGYYAASVEGLDPTGKFGGTRVSWEGKCPVATCLSASPEVVLGSGRSQYIITRLCAGNGDFIQINCVRPVAVDTSTALSRRGLSYGSEERLGANRISPYFRIVTRTVGVRGSVSFTETLVHF